MILKIFAFFIQISLEAAKCVRTFTRFFYFARTSFFEWRMHLASFLCIRQMASEKWNKNQQMWHDADVIAFNMLRNAKWFKIK